MAKSRSARARRSKGSPRPPRPSELRKKAAVSTPPPIAGSKVRPLGVDDRLAESKLIFEALVERAHDLLVRRADHGAEVANNPSAAVAGKAGSYAGGPSGLIGVAIERVSRSVQVVQGVRNVVHSRLERLMGGMPEPLRDGDGKDPKPSPCGDVHELHAAITALEAELSVLAECVDRLTAL